MSLYSRLDRLAADVEKLNRQVTAVANSPQSQRTSVEGGSIDFNDADGNLMAIMGGQDDGSNTIRHVDGPIPPVPSGLSAHVDGPIVQVSWDGSFEDADTATWDWSHLEVIAVGPNSENLRATINDVTGATANLAATASGEWTVVARSVSRAEKRSLDGDAGTVEVKLVDIDGAIEAVQDSANGKNKVTYSDSPPTPADPGIFDDTWFVGQVGRPNDIVEATNLMPNPSFETAATVDMPHANITLTNPTVAGSPSGGRVLRATMKAGSHGTYEFSGQYSANTHGAQWVAAALMSKPGAGNASRWRGVRLADTVIGGSTEYTNITGISDASGWTRQVATKQLRPNASYARFVLYYQGSSAMGSAPVAGDVFESDSWVVATGDSEASALAKIESYFDGDTPSGTTDNESHYRWTGTPHASTSERYLPALNIGDSDNWNVIEQYRHDGTGWVKVELSHHVFSTVDLGKATVGELDGIRIMGQTIRGEQLSGDAIDGKVITGPTIQSGRSGRRWIGDRNAIRIINDDDDVRTQLSPDGSTFKGEVEADTLVVNQGAEFNGNNTLAQGANLTLAAGVTDPTAPPVVQPYWDGIEFDYPAYVDQESKTDVTGLAFDGTNYWTVKTSGNWGDWPDGVFGNAVRINATTGATTGFAVPFTDSNERFGVTCIGSELFWLYRDGYEGRILVTDLNCVKKRETSWNIGYSKTSPLGYKPGIGNDGTNIVIAQCADAGDVAIHTCNKTTGALISTVYDSADRTRSDITGVYVGNADWGRKLVTVAKKSTGELPSFSPTSGAYDGAVTKFNAASPNSTGVVYVDGKWRTLDPSGVIHEYADNNTGDGSGDWWAAYRWYKYIGGFPLVAFVSRISSATRFSWPRRAKLKIMGQPLPVGVPTIEPALAKKTAAPGRTDFRVVPAQMKAGASTTWYDSLPADWLNKAVPTESNTFPEAESSVLQSASGTFRVQGDGSGHWGPLTFNTDGTVAGVPRVAAGRVTITPVANTPTSVTVNLPAGRFTSAPIATATARTGGTNVVSAVAADSETTSTIRVSITRSGATATEINWTAVQP